MSLSPFFFFSPWIKRLTRLVIYIRSLEQNPELTTTEKRKAKSYTKKFPLNASWADLINHCQTEHMKACEDMEKLISACGDEAEDATVLSFLFFVCLLHPPPPPSWFIYSHFYFILCGFLFLSFFFLLLVLCNVFERCKINLSTWLEVVKTVLSSVNAYIFSFVNIVISYHRVRCTVCLVALLRGTVYVYEAGLKEGVEWRKYTNSWSSLLWARLPPFLNWYVFSMDCDTPDTFL